MRDTSVIQDERGGAEHRRRPVGLWMLYIAGVFGFEIDRLGGARNFAAPLAAYMEKWGSVVSELREGGWGPKRGSGLKNRPAFPDRLGSPAHARDLNWEEPILQRRDLVRYDHSGYGRLLFVVR